MRRASAIPKWARYFAKTYGLVRGAAGATELEVRRQKVLPGSNWGVDNLRSAAKQ
jgi:hypothetical protein